MIKLIKAKIKAVIASFNEKQNINAFSNFGRPNNVVDSDDFMGKY